MKNENEILLMTSATLMLLFLIGMFAIDNTFSYMNIKGVVGQSLIFKAMSPRVVYHSGVLLAIVSFLSEFFIVVHVIFRRAKPKRKTKRRKAIHIDVFVR